MLTEPTRPRGISVAEIQLPLAVILPESPEPPPVAAEPSHDDAGDGAHGDAHDDAHAGSGNAPAQNAADGPCVDGTLRRGPMPLWKRSLPPVACSAVCLALGYYFGSPPVPSVELGSARPVARIAPADGNRYQASHQRRNEPLQPLVPFDGLDPEIVELGGRLFRDSGLSRSGRMSCVTCHDLATEGSRIAAVPRRRVADHGSAYDAPTVYNAALSVASYWDGRATTLEEQVDMAIQSPIEMDSNWNRVLRYLSSDAGYQRAFQKLLGGPPTAERVRTAIATFQRSLVTRGSRFDQWLMGDELAMSTDERAGYYLFKKMNCVGCHGGPTVGGTTFRALGRMEAYFARDGAPAPRLGRFEVTGEARDRGVFRVPQLRNVALTAPYFHDGSVATLDEAVALMIQYQCDYPVNDEDVRRITSFLRTLTGEPLTQSAGR